MVANRLIATGRRMPVLAVLVLLLLVGMPSSLALAAPSETPFEIVPGSFHFSVSTSQAGAHSDWTTTFDFAHDSAHHTFNDPRNILFNLPAGFDASNTAVPTCTVGQLIGNQSGLEVFGNPACSPASQVGTITFVWHAPGGAFGGKGEPEELTVPLFNIQTTSTGVAAELGFNVFGDLIETLAVSVRPGDLGLTVTASNIEKRAEPHAISVVVWGLPASHEHDAERGLECRFGIGGLERSCATTLEGAVQPGVTPLPANVPVKPFLSNPTSCGMSTATLEADSWEHPGEWARAQTQVGPIGECERVPFEPAAELQPSTRSAESPTGLEVSLVVPQAWENPFSISTANLKDAVVTLPQGMTINPSAGSGLGSCSPAQFAAETASSAIGAGCPPESKIGSIQIQTPLLEEPIPPVSEGTGAVYVATPYDNPFHSLLALYVVAKDPKHGIIVKVAGEVRLDPVTGQLTATFANNPQQPFNRFTLKFRPGATAPLVSPPVCGTFTSTAALTPWSAPAEAHDVTSSFPIAQGVHEGPCPSGATPPFHPQVVAGTQNNAAGSYSPFYLRIVREDGEQEITRFSTIMPPGLTGNLSGIPFCPDSAIQTAKEQSGAQAETSPACPATSQVGHSLVGAGVGSVLAQTPGRLYLAGPYHGAPLSLVSVTSAKVGPFDLGTVVIRFGLRINPLTAQVEVDASTSDPIPHIIKGVVVHVRDIRAYVDRPGFIINPTSCERMSIGNVVTGAGADPANPADQAPVPTSSPFQAANCASLNFKPSFKVTTSAKTSKANGASLSVNLAMPGALGTNANIHQVKVELPVQLPSRLTTLQKACTKAQFDTNPAGCPAASVVGHARAITPILPVPLEGPAYFVSNGAEAFPNLIIVLQGYGITIDLVGDTFISKAGITSSTFKTVPDQPVQSFELTLPQGPFSALTANTDLCALTKTVTVKKKVTVRSKNGRKRTVVRKVKQTVATSLSMPTEFVAQNDAVIHQTTAIAETGCPKMVKKSAVKKRARRHGRRRA